MTTEVSKGAKPSDPRIRIELWVPEKLAREYLTFMSLAHMMGNLDVDNSPRDRLDMVLCGALGDALDKRAARIKGKGT